MQHKSLPASQSGTVLSQAHLFGATKSSSGLSKIAVKDGFTLYYNAAEKKVYLTKGLTLPFRETILASGNYTESLEAEIALLSNIHADKEIHNRILLDLLSDHLSERRADLFYTEENGDVSIAQDLKRCEHEANIMVLRKKTDKSVMPLHGYQAIDSKEYMLKHLPEITAFLLKHSNWAIEVGEKGLTNELLAKRIIESTSCMILVDPKKGCIGYLSYISNGVVGYGYNFAIHKDLRAHGLGKLLAHKLLEKMPGNELGVLISAYEGPTIKQAKALYGHLGFRTYEENPELRKIVAVLDIPHRSSIKLVSKL